ncbi:mediator of RNA polymerase II transcription subunit 30 [Culicoides brevitarsis]|uniref:mediator of RNA polymerase II transcription subunit 30 n=1 Tax=Culicoides brevitarsis TaxID=469753 RepID=UPI00307B6E80
MNQQGFLPNQGQVIRPAQSPAQQTNNTQQAPTTPQGPPPNQSPAQTGQPQQQQQAPPAQPIHQRDFPLLTLCKIGQDTVIDIVSRFQEVYTLLKVVAPPNGTQQGLTSSMDKKMKVQEQFRTLRLLFKRLRLLFDKVNDGLEDTDYPHIMNFVPLKDGPDTRPEVQITDDYKKYVQEAKELSDMLSTKNRQLREVIDKLRIIIWEINTMLSMRRS